MFTFLSNKADVPRLGSTGLELDLDKALVGLYGSFLLNVRGCGYGHTLIVSGARMSQVDSSSVSGLILLLVVERKVSVDYC